MPLGFVPGGGTSVLPRALGLPRDPVQAAQRVAAGHDAADRARARERPALRLQRRARLRRRARAPVDELGRDPDGRRPATSRSAGRVRRAHRAARPLRAAARGRGARTRGVRARRELLAVHLRRARLPSTSSPEASFEEGLDLVAPVRLRARDLPRLAASRRARPRAQGRQGVLAAHDLDRIVVRCDRAAAAPGGRRGRGRRDRSRVRGRAGRRDRARLTYTCAAMSRVLPRGRRPAPRHRRRRRPSRTARSRGSARTTCSRSTATWSCCGPTTSARSSTTGRAASARTRSSGTTRRCRRARCSRSRSATGSSRATASRRSGCCAGCRRRRSSRWWRGHPAGWWNPRTTTSPRSASRSGRTCRTRSGSRGARG